MQLSAPFPRPLVSGAPGRKAPWVPLVLGTLLVAALGAVGYVAFQRFNTPAVAAPTGTVVEVRRGNVASSVNATGSVVATKQARLVFSTSGRVKEIAVSVGQQVEAGQVLGRLYDDAQRIKLEQAKSQYAAAQLKLQQVTEGATEDEILAAQSSYNAAVAKLQQLEGGPTDVDTRAANAGVVQARASLDAAQAKLNALVSGQTQADQASAQASLESARNQLATAEAKLALLQDGPKDEELVAARAAVEGAKGSLRSVEAKYEQLRTGPTPADLAAAEASYQQAVSSLASNKAKLDQLKVSSTSADVASAQASLASAESSLLSAKRALDSKADDLVVAKADLEYRQYQFEILRTERDDTCQRRGEGTILCRQAQSALDAAYPQVYAAEQKVRQLDPTRIGTEVAIARKALASAQAAYDSAKIRLQQVQTIPAEIIAAQGTYDSSLASVDSAKAKLEQVRAGSLPVDMIAAQVQVDSARGTLATAEAKLKTLEAGASEADLLSAQLAVDSAQAQVVAAEAKLNVTNIAGPQDVAAARLSVESARAGLESAQAKLEQVTAGATEADLESARASVLTAQSALAAKSGSVRSSDIALQQEAVRQAELSLQAAQLDYDNLTLAAPFAGTVAAIAGNVGESAPSGTTGFIVLIDPREVRVDVTVDESDVARIQPGKPVQITFDALPGQNFRGEVLSVSPNSTLTQGVVTYPVTIGLMGRRDQVIPAGLTASTQITIDQVENALLVPSRAVRRVGRQSVVDVVQEDGTTAQRQVRTGVSGEQMVEIVEGLQEGDRVLIPTTTTRAPSTGPGLGAGGPQPATKVQLGH